MSEKELKKQIAFLESVNDQLYSELLSLDEMMRAIGFTNGLETVRETAIEIYEGNVENFEDEVA